MMKHMVSRRIHRNVDGMMNKIADFYDVECEATVGALTSLIEPMLIVFLGVVVVHRHGDVPADFQMARRRCVN